MHIGLESSLLHDIVGIYCLYEGLDFHEFACTATRLCLCARYSLEYSQSNQFCAKPRKKQSNYIGHGPHSSLSAIMIADQNCKEVYSMSRIVDRFFRYISIDTQSDEDSVSSPSTAKQFRLARVLAEELREMGVSNVRLDEEHCYVYGEIPSNLGEGASDACGSLNTCEGASDAYCTPTTGEAASDGCGSLNTCKGASDAYCTPTTDEEISSGCCTPNTAEGASNGCGSLNTGEETLGEGASDEGTHSSNDKCASEIISKNVCGEIVSDEGLLGNNDKCASEIFSENVCKVNANSVDAVPALGFISHMDTATTAPGDASNARIVKNYDGGIIRLGRCCADSAGEELPGAAAGANLPGAVAGANLPGAAGAVLLDPAVYPELLDYVGCDLIVTDGVSLLGADDKAGIAEIMEMAQVLLENPSIRHGKIGIAFTPDEEIGRGTDHFDVEGWGMDFAYTVDGGAIGEIEYENFNAAAARITIRGRDIHPGSAKNIMVNAARIAAELDTMLPQEQRPEHTEGYEGFFHLTRLEGCEAKAEMRYIIRDHDADLFEEKKKLMRACVDYLNAKYNGALTLEIREQYRNMRELIEPHIFLIDNAQAAFEKCGVVPKVVAIRGGTDGAMLTYKGLPCPNLSTGGLNFHSNTEYIPVQSLEKMAEVLIELATV